MNIPNEFIGLGGTAFVALQAWTLAEVVKLKTKVAVIAATCNQCNNNNGYSMKAKSLITAVALAGILSFGVIGCGSIYTKTAAQPATVQPVFGLVHDAAGNVIIGQVGTTNIPPHPSAFVVNSNLQAALDAGQALAGTVATLPTPAAPVGMIASALLGLASLGLGVFARYKSGQLTASNAALTAVVAGVETIGDAMTKQRIQTLAVANGSQDHLDGVVQKVSGAINPETPAGAK